MISTINKVYRAFFVDNNKLWWYAFSLIVISLAIFGFVYRSNKYGKFFAEDAYISYRFAENLAEGRGLVWNLGGEPVEGYTSPLHIFLLALGIKLGIPVGVASLIISFLSVAGLLIIYWMLINSENKRMSPIGAVFIAIFIIDFSLAIHTTSGLDTTLFMFMVAIDFVISITFVKNPNWLTSISLAFINFLLLLTRPDASAYILGQILVIFAFSIYQTITLRKSKYIFFSALSYAVLLIVGCAYLFWKYKYFGYILPNPYYIKSNEFTSFNGYQYVISYVKMLVKRFGLITLIMFVFLDYKKIIKWLKQPHSIIWLALAIVPTILFLLYYTTVIHEVGYLYRFEYPTYFFFALILGLLLSLGSPVENLFSRLSVIIKPVFLAPIILLLGFAFIYFTYKSSYVYFPWFQLVEEGYYQPVSQALRNTNLAEKATLVLDSAGTIPYRSRFSHIDPVGLTDNYLSGRNEITIWEREEYIWGSNPDVYIGPEPPASPGATDCLTDPISNSTYMKNVLLRSLAGGPYQKTYGSLSTQERCEVIHYRMRELRDRWDFLGEIRYPAPIVEEYTHFIYVRGNSLYAEQLGSALMSLITKNPNEIIFTSAE